MGRAHFELPTFAASPWAEEDDGLSGTCACRCSRLVSSRSRTLPCRCARSTGMASGGGGCAAARMDPEAATELVRKGSTLVLLDVPQRTLFGIDTQVGPILPPTTESASDVRACVKRLTGLRLRLLPALVLLQVFSVGPKFKGMKMVPPGPHFVYYCSSSRYKYELATVPILQHVNQLLSGNVVDLDDLCANNSKAN